MKAFELFTESGASTKIWACGQCKCVHRNKDHADGCCKCIDCEKEERSPHRLRCAACGGKYTEEQNAEQREKERLAMEKAEIVDCEFGLFHGDKYLKEVEDMDGELYFDEVMPEFCFAAKPVRFRKWHIDTFLDSEDEEYGLEEPGEITFTGLDALRKAFDDFNADNEGISMCYEIDYSKKVQIVLDT